MPYRAEAAGWTSSGDRMWFHRCDQCGKCRLVDTYFEIYPPLHSKGDEAGWWWACASCLVSIISDQLEAATDDEAPAWGGHAVGQDYCDEFDPGPDGIHCARCRYPAIGHSDDDDDATTAACVAHRRGCAFCNEIEVVPGPSKPDPAYVIKEGGPVPKKECDEGPYGEGKGNG